MSPAGWLGALILFHLPWLDISCSNSKGEITCRRTMSGAQLVLNCSTDRTERPERDDAQRDAPEVKIEIAPDAIKPDPKWIAGRWLLAVYGFLLIICLSFALLRPSKQRASAGVLCSMILLALLLTGSWLLLERPVFPSEPERMFGEWVVVNYTSWYYGSYLANLAVFLCYGIELWGSRNRGAPAEVGSP